MFTNDFAALRPDTSDAVVEGGLFRAEGTRGTCRVVCFSPRHDLTLAGMATDEIRHIVDVWADETTELGRRSPWVQVFENHGEAMGASIRTRTARSGLAPRGPSRPPTSTPSRSRQFEATGPPAAARLCPAGARRAAGRRRMPGLAGRGAVLGRLAVRDAADPDDPRARLADLDDAARDGLAAALQDLTRRYDALFDRPFPYSMGWHQAPFDAPSTEAWQVHAHFYPPLLRASVRKFMVGYELLAEPQRDLTPEEAAERLRAAVPANRG